MPEARSEVQIVISGSAVGLKEALGHAQAALSTFGAQADRAGAQAGEHLASGEHKAAHEAMGLGERAKVAAEMVSLLGAESSEQVLKVEGLSHAFGEAQHAFGGFGGAIAATAGSFALFRGLDFMHESVDEAMKGEAAWARLSAAYAGNASALGEVKEQIEGASESWAALGMNQSQVADLAARARGRGLDVRAILGDPQALADTAAALGPGTGIAGALDALASPRGGRQVLARLGLSGVQLRGLTQEMQYMTAAQRAAFIEQQVEASHFKGVGTAFEQTDAGKLLKFHTMMQNLQEEVGTALLPALLQLVEAMTSLLQTAQNLAQPFGGLANVIRTLFVPMLGLGLLLFTNLRGVMTRLVDVLLGRLLGAFSQTAESMAAADAQARTLAADVRGIPEIVTTTAAFVPATAIKDAYKANIYSIPTTWTTTAVFEPASVKEPAMAPVKVPVVYEGTLKEATPHPLTVPVRYVGRALGTGLAVGTAMAITDAIFNSVTIKHVTLPPQKAPAYVPQTTTTATTVLIAGTPHVAISGTPNVAVTNLGAIGPALVGAGARTSPVVRTVTLPSTVTLPKTMDVNAHQSGSWEIGLKPDTWQRFGQMLGEITLGVVLANVISSLGKWGWDKLKDLIGGLRGKGKGGGTAGGSGGDEGLPLPKTEADWVKQVLAQAEKQGATGGATPGGKTGGGSIPVVSGLTDAVKGIDWGKAWSAALGAAKFTAALAAAIGAFFAAAFGLLGKGLSALGGGPHAAMITPGPMAAQLVVFGLGIVQGVGEGLKKGAAGLANIFIDVFNGVIQRIKNLPGVGGLFGGVHPIPHLGTGGKGGLSTVSPAFVAHLHTVAGAGLAQTAAGVHHHAHNVTLHAPITINGAHDPVAVGRQVNRALSEFMQGARSQRRLHG